MMYLEAREQWAKSQTGPLKELYGSFALGFFRSAEVNKAKESDSLDKMSKKLIIDSKVPHFELIMVSSISQNSKHLLTIGNPICTKAGPPMPPCFDFGPEDSFFSATAIGMNPQSRGAVTLRSSNSDDPPLIDFAYLSHPYDKRIIVTAVRQLLQYINQSPLAEELKEITFGPKSEDEEDILVRLPLFL
jgi:choline dehydrogenase-like flavoprotein